MQALRDVPAPAKINLFLHIVGRRADGYHLLQSGFVLIDWMDTLHFERNTSGVLRRHDLGPALPANDLCLQAARALQTASACDYGADIYIDKQVPWGAGMGGGSSDAASTLLALNRLWGLNWSRADLMALGETLGADVPFFIGGHNAFVEGIGEQLTPLSLPPLTLAVVKPPAAINTREIFLSEDLARDTKPVIVSGFADTIVETKSGAAGEPVAFWGHNDLQAPAERRYPEVAQAAQWLQSRFGNSRMTGSGSAVFAKVQDSSDIGHPPSAINWLAAMPADWVGRLCRSLPEHPLFAWAS